MFGIKKLRHDLYWLRKEFDNLKDDVIKLKATEYHKNNPAEFKAGDNATYKETSDGSRVEMSVTILREDEPNGFTRKYWVDNGYKVFSAAEYRLFTVK